MTENEIPQLRIERLRLAAVLICLLVAILAPIAEGAATSATQADAGIRSALPETSQWGLVVMDVATGREAVRAGSAGLPLTPGSLVKLVVTGAVLDRAAGGGGPTLGTSLSHDGTLAEGVLRGNLYLTGCGNALLSAADLDRMAAALSGHGVLRVEGDVVINATYLDPLGLQRKRRGASYAEAGALGLDLHTVALSVTPSRTGTPPSVLVEPPNEEVRVAVEARTADLPQSDFQVIRLSDVEYRVTGHVAHGAVAKRTRFSLDGPALYAGGTLATLLRKRGILVSGSVAAGKTPANTTVLAEAAPPEWDRLLAMMNGNSLNVVSDNLLLALGAERYGAPGTLQKGVQAVQLFLAGLGFAPEAATIQDGSGLSGDNRMSALFMAQFLQRSVSQRWFGRLYDSLPRSGGEGTLRDVGFSDERFRVKSGTLENAYALAGYGVDSRGKPLAFAFIVNHPAAGFLDLNRAGAAVLRYLSTEVSL